MIPLAQADRPFDPEASSSQPTVSVIIPTYNRASLVQEAIASVLSKLVLRLLSLLWQMMVQKTRPPPAW
jgi:cellulose synthase/poly-beta-1,6-N-acetylglucosamine synthase-like glycosyltransferase